MLWHPAEALGLALGAIRLESSALTVDRGGAVTLTIRAAGRRAAVLVGARPGRDLAVATSGSSTRSARPASPPARSRRTSSSAPRAEGGTSDTLHVAVRIPAFLGAVSVTAQYPTYLGLEDELLSFGPDSIMLPEGTRLLVEGEATAPLASARWVGPAGPTTLTVDDGRFSGPCRCRWHPVPYRPGAHHGERLAARRRGRDAVVRLVSDSAPTVSIPVPGADTLAPLGLTVPLVIDAHDDHGLVIGHDREPAHQPARASRMPSAASRSSIPDGRA